VTLQAIVRRLVTAAQVLDLVTTEASLVGMCFPMKVAIRAVRCERRHAPGTGGNDGQCGYQQDDKQQSVHGGSLRTVKGGQLFRKPA